MSIVKVLNIRIHNTSCQELLRKIARGGILFTPNVDHLIKLQKDPDFYHLYQEADYIVCDSKIIFFASRLLGNPLQEKISGSDFFPKFYDYYKHDETIKIFLLGGLAGIAQRACQRINAKVNRPIVVGAHSPSFGFEKNDAECQEIVKSINESGATVLAVGVGAPKQEKWIYKYKNQLENIRIFLAVGATLDYEAGNLQRAPEWMSNAGIEWFYRLISEPKRLWKRYLVEGLPFFGLILLQKLNLYTYKAPIGIILQQAGLLSSEQVDRILQLQKNDRHRFGELAIQQGWLKQETVNFLVHRLSKLFIESQKQPIGQQLKAAALLDDAQIGAILREQEQTGLLFGEMAINKGWVSQKTLAFFLEAFKPQELQRGDRKLFHQTFKLWRKSRVAEQQGG